MVAKLSPSGAVACYTHPINKSFEALVRNRGCACVRAVCITMDKVLNLPPWLTAVDAFASTLAAPTAPPLAPNPALKGLLLVATHIHTFIDALNAYAVCPETTTGCPFSPTNECDMLTLLLLLLLLLPLSDVLVPIQKET